MSTYPVIYEIKSGKGLTPCPNGMPGLAIPIVMLGSEFCRENCIHRVETGAGYVPGEPVRCRFDEAVK
jgi:hypothetical protein